MSTLDLTAGARRVRGMAHTNTIVLLRNRLATFYAFGMPLAGLGLLAVVNPDQPLAAMTTITTVLVMALLFPVYYNMLSAFVTRRDELVLKRLRTGELRDSEIITSMALPGTVIALVVTSVTLIVVPLAGFDAAANPLGVLLGMLIASIAFTALAIWTAAWTRNAEAAQLTSAPVILVAVFGLMRGVFPADWRDGLVVLPGAAIEDLVRYTWFGEAADGSELSCVGSLVESAPAFAALVCWTALGFWLARRSMAWEPRA